MYHIAIYLYLIGVAILSLFNRKVKKMWKGEREAVRTLREKVDPNAKYIWFHAASLGEFEQGRPLLSIFANIIQVIRFYLPSFRLQDTKFVKTMSMLI